MADKMEKLTVALRFATSEYILAKDATAKAKKREEMALKKAVKARDAVDAERKRVLAAL